MFRCFPGPCVLLLMLCLDFSEDAWALKKRAPNVDAVSAHYKPLCVYHNYNWTSVEQAKLQDKIRLILSIRDDDVLHSTQPIIAEVKLTDISDYETIHIRYLPVTIDCAANTNETSGFVEITNDDEFRPLIELSKVYRVFVNLHRKSDVYDEKSVIGRVCGPYYVATSGGTKMERARQGIVMRTFKEFYYRNCGWRSGEKYPMDCYAYYLWATGPYTVGAEDGRTKLRALFGFEKTKYHTGKDIAELGGCGLIHADYVRKPGHSFMLLSYDERQQHVWTMEGNYNHRIEIVIRSVRSDWKVGHLLEEHIRLDEVPVESIQADEERMIKTGS